MSINRNHTAWTTMGVDAIYTEWQHVEKTCKPFEYRKRKFPLKTNIICEYACICLSILLYLNLAFWNHFSFQFKWFSRFTFQWPFEAQKVLPSKLPFSLQNSSSFSCVSLDGLKTNTPELKQSGQPGSGAADSSSRSNSSSTFDRTWIHSNKCYCYKLQNSDVRNKNVHLV